MWVIIAIFVILFVIYNFVDIKPNGMPPGPTLRLPLIGTMYKIGSDQIPNVSKLRKQ